MELFWNAVNKDKGVMSIFFDQAEFVNNVLNHVANYSFDV